MALIFMDGFESETNVGQIQLNQCSGTAGASNPGFSVDSAVKRNGDNSMKFGRIVGANGSQSCQYVLYKELGVDTTQLVVGFGIMWTFGGASARATDQTFLQLSTTNWNGIHIKFRGDDKRLEVIGNDNTSYGLGPSILVDGLQYYFQVKAIADATNGSVKVMLGNNIEFDLTSIPVIPSTGIFNRIMFMYNQGAHLESGWFNLDDIYVLDSTGPNNIDFLGPCKITKAMSNAAGDVSTFIRVTSATYGWDAIKEVYADAAQYITGNTSNQKILVNLSDITATTSIKGIRIHACGNRGDMGSGFTKCNFVLRDSSDNEYLTSEFYFGTTSWITNWKCVDIDPFANCEQSQDKINELQVGILINASC